MQQHGLIFTISGPSGAGKDTLARLLVENDDNIKFFATATTRTPRAGEEHGKDYYFLTKEEFLHQVEQNGFIEWIEYHNNYYGALKSVVDGYLQKGNDIVSDITVHGARALLQFKPEQTVRFVVLPPSYEELARRFADRRRKSGEDDATIALRLARIREDLENWRTPGYVFQNPDLEGATLADFDHVIVNDDLASSLQQMQAIVAKERQLRAQSKKAQ